MADSEEDEQRSKEVLASLKEYLSSLPFMFQNASIITGQEEGLYGWITVNYLMGNFLEVRHCLLIYHFPGESAKVYVGTAPKMAQRCIKFLWASYC